MRQGIILLGRLAIRTVGAIRIAWHFSPESRNSLRVRGGHKPTKSLLEPAGWSAGTAGGGGRGRLRKLPRHEEQVWPASLNNSRTATSAYKILQQHRIAPSRTVLSLGNPPSTCCVYLLPVTLSESDVRPRESRGGLRSMYIWQCGGRCLAASTRVLHTTTVHSTAQTTRCCPHRKHASPRSPRIHGCRLRWEPQQI